MMDENIFFFLFVRTCLARYASTSPIIDALDDVGAKLLKNPSLRGTEREEVANERAAIMRDWDQLNSDALNMQSKLVQFTKLFS